MAKNKINTENDITFKVKVKKFSVVKKAGIAT